MKSVRCGVLVGSLLLALPVFAQGKPAREAGSEPVKEPSILVGYRLNENEKSHSGDIFRPNLSLRRFLVSYKSKDIDERTAAHAFLLGVADTTEGKLWCSYYRFKSITVLEIIYSGLQGIDSSRYDERAAHVITEILEKRHPCNKEH